MAPVCLDHTSPLLVTHFFDVLHLPGSTSLLLYILGILHTEITNCLICDTHSFVVPIFLESQGGVRPFDKDLPKRQDCTDPPNSNITVKDFQSFIETSPNAPSCLLL